MLERSKILKTIQQCLLDSDNKLYCIKNFTFSDDAKITIIIKDRLIDIEYTEVDQSSLNECLISFCFEGLPYESLLTTEILELQIRSKLKIALKKQQDKINYQQMNLNDILTEEQKETYLSSSKIVLIIDRTPNDISVSIGSSYI